MLLSNRGKGLFIAVLVVPCAIAIVPIWTALHATRQTRESIRWIDHTNEVKSHLDSLVTRLLEAELAEREYRITGDPKSLEPYAAARAAIAGEIASIAELTRDNAGAQHAAGELGQLADQRARQIEEIVALARSGEVGPGVSSEKSGSALADIRHVVDAMRAHEDELLRGRQATLAYWATRRTRLMTGLSIANAVFAVAVYYVARRWWRVSGIVKMCAWSKTIEYEGEWLSFEAYLHRRFGINTSHGISPREADKLGWTEGAHRPGKGE